MAKAKAKLNITTPHDTEHANAIIYGASGAGKTRLLGTAVDCEQTSPALLLDFESGTRTLRGVKIDVIRPQSWREIQDIYDFFIHDNKKYQSVLLDSVTEIQKKYSLGVIMDEMGGDELSHADLGKNEAPNRKDWNRTNLQMSKLIRSFRDLAYNPKQDCRVHVFFSALESYREKKDLMCPTLSGALGEDCGAMVDFLFRLSRQNIVKENKDGEEVKILKRFLLTDSHINEDGILYMGKNRGKGMPKGIWEPTMSKLIECIQNEGGGEK